MLLSFALLILSACDISPEREALFATAAHSATPAAASDPPIPTSDDAAELAPTAAVSTPIEEETVQSNTVPVLGSVVDADGRTTALDAYLSNLEQSGQFMGSVLVVENGQVVLNNGYGMADVEAGRPNSPETQLRIGSITKQFTAAAILRLQELGLLDVSDPISNYLPDYRGGEQITIHQLLTHTAGVPNYTRRQDLAQLVQTPIELDALIDTFAQQALDFPPGQAYAYSDSGYVLLTKVIEVASGQPYAQFLQSEVLDPLDLNQTGYDYLSDNVPQRASGYQLTPDGPRKAIDTDSSWPSGAGALYSTTSDLYRWSQALHSGQLLQASSQEAMFQPWADTGQGFSYGYGWEIGQMAGHASQMHAGTIFGFGSFIAYFPDDDATVIVLSNGLQMAPRRIAADLARILFGG